MVEALKGVPKLKFISGWIWDSEFEIKYNLEVVASNSHGCCKHDCI